MLVNGFDIETTWHEDYLEFELARREESDEKRLPITPHNCRMVSAASIEHVVGTSASDSPAVMVIKAMSDEEESKLVRWCLPMFALQSPPLVTYNGWKFDIPFVYRRAAILGINPGECGAPTFQAFARRFQTGRNYDVMQLWSNWGSDKFVGLDDMAFSILGEHKIEIDYAGFPEMVKTPEGRDKLATYNQDDVYKTLRFFDMIQGVLLDE